jgi:hypothetical protein
MFVFLDHLTYIHLKGFFNFVSFSFVFYKAKKRQTRWGVRGARNPRKPLVPVRDTNRN